MTACKNLSSLKLVFHDPRETVDLLDVLLKEAYTACGKPFDLTVQLMGNLLHHLHKWEPVLSSHMDKYASLDVILRYDVLLSHFIFDHVEVPWVKEKLDPEEREVVEETFSKIAKAGRLRLQM